MRRTSNQREVKGFRVDCYTVVAPRHYGSLPGVDELGNRRLVWPMTFTDMPGLVWLAVVVYSITSPGLIAHVRAVIGTKFPFVRAVSVESVAAIRLVWPAAQRLPCRPMMHTRAALIALVFNPSMAFAGPIEWSYTATFSGDENPDRLYLGHHVRPDSFEPSGYRQGTIYGTPTALNATGQHNADAHFRFGQLSDSGVGVIWWDGGTPPPGGISTTFTGGLTITDAASGATGAFLISGTGEIISDPMLYDFSLGLILDGRSEQEKLIGSTRYHVNFSTETDGDGVWLAADITTATPEPSTLVLLAWGFWPIVRRTRPQKNKPVPAGIGSR